MRHHLHILLFISPNLKPTHRGEAKNRATPIASIAGIGCSRKKIPIPNPIEKLTVLANVTANMSPILFIYLQLLNNSTIRVATVPHRRNSISWVAYGYFLMNRIVIYLFNVARALTAGDDLSGHTWPATATHRLKVIALPRPINERTDAPRKRANGRGIEPHTFEGEPFYGQPCHRSSNGYSGVTFPPPHARFQGAPVMRPRRYLGSRRLDNTTLQVPA